MKARLPAAHPGEAADATSWIEQELAGCPFTSDRDQDARWNEPFFLIDVAPGGGDTFSLEGPDGIHFVARPSAS